MVKREIVPASLLSYARRASLTAKVLLALAASAGGSGLIARTYQTSFAAAENPFSEGGLWINGKTTGLDWADVRAVKGFAFGTQTGSEARDNDSTAILSGPWKPNQSAKAIVRSTRQNSAAWEEVEIRLRTNLSAHSCTGYEINFRSAHDGSQYVEIVRWNGALDDFTYLAKLNGGPGIKSGDVVAATISGDTISAYINGVLVLRARDSKFTEGSPGLGFYLKGQSGDSSEFGFSSFMASDEESFSP